MVGAGRGLADPLDPDAVEASRAAFRLRRRGRCGHLRRATSPLQMGSRFRMGLRHRCAASAPQLDLIKLGPEISLVRRCRVAVSYTTRSARAHVWNRFRKSPWQSDLPMPPAVFRVFADTAPANQKGRIRRDFGRLDRGAQCWLLGRNRFGRSMGLKRHKCPNCQLINDIPSLRGQEVD